MKCGATRQKSVEVGRTVTDAIRVGDEDLPAFVNKRPSFGDGDGNA
jgi:hypothetical protein